jgi:hypothetical protein
MLVSYKEAIAVKVLKKKDKKCMCIFLNIYSFAFKIKPDIIEIDCQ